MNISKTTACSSTEVRLSKTTLLALLETKSAVGFKVGDAVSYVKESGLTFEYRVVSIGATTAVITNSQETITVSKNLLKTKGPLTIFDKLENSEWSIVSFDPKTRIACIEIDNGIVLQTISVIVPAII